MEKKTDSIIIEEVNPEPISESHECVDKEEQFDNITVTECKSEEDETQKHIHTENKPLLTEKTSNSTIFKNIYENQIWGKNCCDEFDFTGSSGPSAKLNYNRDYVVFMKKFILNNRCKSVIDLGCGDWEHSSTLYDGLNIQYYGYDVYDKLINGLKVKYPQYHFQTLDVIQQKNLLRRGDICILKDFCEYICNEDIVSLLNHIIDNKLYKYIFIVNTYNKENKCCDIETNGKQHKISFHNSPLNVFKATVMMKYKGKELLMISCL